jgi:hypothetical protein
MLDSMGRAVVPSPDGLHQIVLQYVAEIRFGPAYYSLTIDDIHFGDRLFGEEAVWAPDSSIACVTEWHTIDYEAGPITSLLLVRPASRTFSAFPKVQKGFATPLRFIGSTLVLQHKDEWYRNGHVTAVRETDLERITDWAPL